MIDDGLRIVSGAHLASTDGVVESHRVLLDETLQVGIGIELELATRRVFQIGQPHLVLLHGRRPDHFAGEFQTCPPMRNTYD